MGQLKDAVLQILGAGRPLKAKEIAEALARHGFPGIDRSQVNSLLHGELRQQVSQDRQYRWSLAKKDGTVGKLTGGAASRPATLLGRLCSYYTDCLYADGMGDISVFAQSRGIPDYVEIGPGQELTEEGGDGQGILSRVPAAAGLFAAQRRDHNRTTLYYGYPVFLKWIQSRRSNWEGVKSNRSLSADYKMSLLGGTASGALLTIGPWSTRG